MTPTKMESIGSNLSPLEEWIQGRIADNAYPFNRELVSIRHLRSKGVMPHSFDRYSDHKIAAALRKAGAIYIDKQIVLSDKSRAKLWAVGDRKDILSNPHNLDVNLLRKLYEESILDVEPGNPILNDKSF